jgi:hypothetical protein
MLLLLVSCGGQEPVAIEGAFGYFFGEKHSFKNVNNLSISTWPHYVSVPPKTDSQHFEQLTLGLSKAYRIVEIGGQRGFSSAQDAKSAFNALKEELLQQYPAALTSESSVDVVSAERTILLRLEVHGAESSLSFISRAGDLVR